MSVSYTKAVDSRFETWGELLAFVAHGPRECETLTYKAPLDRFPFVVEVKKVFKNGKIRIHAGELKFTADAGHLDRFTLQTIGTLPDNWLVIGRGKAGWHAASARCSSSGGTLEDISYPPREYVNSQPYFKAGYLAEASEGCHVYDAVGADDCAFASFIIGGPILKPELGDDGEDCFTKADAETAARMLPALEGGFEHIAARGIAEVAAGRKYGSLDRVGWNIWRRECKRRVPGVRFGVVRNHEVIWE